MTRPRRPFRHARPFASSVSGRERLFLTQDSQRILQIVPGQSPVRALTSDRVTRERYSYPHPVGQLPGHFFGSLFKPVEISALRSSHFAS